MNEITQTKRIRTLKENFKEIFGEMLLFQMNFFIQRKSGVIYNTI